MMPRVSVIVPCFNAAETLADTVASVRAQTFTDWELLLLDDGSEDDSADIAHTLAAVDPRILVVRKSNSGVSATRNQGVAQARSDTLAFLDADDLWTPTTLAVHLAHLACNPDVGVAFARIGLMTPGGHRTAQRSSGCLRDLSATDLLAENPTCTCSNLVVRREVFEAVGGFDESMSFVEDLEWLFRVLTGSRWRLQGIDQQLVWYRTSPEGLSSDLYRMEAGWERFVEKARQYAPDTVRQAYPRARAIHLRYLARRALRTDASARVAADFQRRSLASDWTLLIHEPRRSWLTLGAVLGKLAAHRTSQLLFRTP